MHIQVVTPKHGQQVSNADLVIGVEQTVTGICARFDFSAGAGMGDSPTDLVQFVLNGEDISGSLDWTVTDDAPPSSGNGCYSPPVELTAGLTAATVRYSDSTGREFLYTWKFEITE